jgi:hypothetical protein
MMKKKMLWGLFWALGVLSCTAQCDVPCQMQRELDEFTAAQTAQTAAYARERQRYIDSLKTATVRTKTEAARLELTADYRTLTTATAQVDAQQDSVAAAEREALAIAIAKLKRASEQRIAAAQRQATEVKATHEAAFRFKWSALPPSVVQSCVGACPSLLKILTVQ